MLAEIISLLNGFKPYKIVIQRDSQPIAANLYVVTVVIQGGQLKIMTPEKKEFIIPPNWPNSQLYHKISIGLSKLQPKEEEFILNTLIQEKKLEDRKRFLESFSLFLDQLPEISEELQEGFNEIADLQLDHTEEDDDEKGPKLEKFQVLKEKILHSFLEKHKFKDYQSLANGPKFLDDYPEHGKKLKRLFEMLKFFTLEQTHLKYICETLNISQKKFMKYFPNPKVCDKKEDPLYKIELPRKLSSVEETCKTFEEVFHELEQLNCDISFITEIKKTIIKIDNYYKNFAGWNVEDITRWCQKQKENPKNFDLAFAIAVLELANELATGGQRLHITQKVAICLLLLSNEEKGHISQISTGEGKTTIIAFISALRVMQGMKVHVITSNEVLAAEAVKTKIIFYSLLGISVAHNNNEKLCYTRDIVYGSINNFQFDWLRNSFEQIPILDGLDFGQVWVILDEIDSLLIDQGANIAKLSGPFAGMECLRYVYLNIWACLEKCEAEVDQEMNCTLHKRAEELISTLFQDIETKYPGLVKENEKQSFVLSLINSFQLPSMNEEIEKMRNEALEAYSEIERTAHEEYLKKIKIKMMDKILIPDEVIEHRLQGYVQRNKETWIEYAIEAKFQYNLNVEYKIMTNQENEKIIVPVDYQNTGVSLINTLFSKGVHQFLQLKENLTLTYENLTSCYISNISYVRLYGTKISGVTGTLGSLPERKLLSELFNLSFSIIPTYKAKIFQEFPGLVIADKDFHQRVADAALVEYMRNRASLVICSSIRDVENFTKKIQMAALSAGLEPNIQTYRDELEASVTEVELNSGDIVITTNIGGRGTDFKTSQMLQLNGGLHVILTFLPGNQRVQDQAFGRTSRQGNLGTGQILTNISEVAQIFGMEIETEEIESLEFRTILKKRDQQESNRVAQLREYKVLELLYKDKLFNKFSYMYSSLKTQYKTNIKWVYVLRDLKERWAFWREENEINILNFINQKKRKEQDLDEIIQKDFAKFEELSKEIRLGEICYNPYNAICLAERYLEEGDNKSRHLAKKELEALERRNHKLPFSAYMKLFEIAIDNGGQILKRYQKALGEILNIEVEIDDFYKEKALNYLEEAEKGLNIEYKYLSEFMSDKDKDKDKDKDDDYSFKIDSILTTATSNSENGSEEVNLLFKHLSARLNVLDIYLNNIKNLKGQILEMKQGIVIGTKIPGYLLKLDPKIDHEKVVKESITNKAVYELEFVGMGSIIELKEVHDVPATITQSAQEQIKFGTLLFASAVPFPFLAPALLPIASLLITEGISDIITSLIDQGESAFKKSDYVKGKLISYGISLATMGIGALINTTKFLNKAIKICKSFADKLRSVKGPFARICHGLASQIDKLTTYFELCLMAKKTACEQAEMLVEIHKKASEAQKLGDLVKYDKLLKQFQQFDKIMKSAEVLNNNSMKILKNIVKKETTQVVFSVVSEKILIGALDQILKNLKPFLQRTFKNSVKKMQIEILQYTKDTLKKQLQDTFDTNQSEEVLQFVKEISFGVLRQCNKVQTVLLMFEFVLAGIDICCYADRICQKFLQGLQQKEKSKSQISKEEADTILDHLSTLIADSIYKKIVSMTGKGVITLGKTFYRHYKRRQEKQAEKRSLESIKKRIEDVNNSERAAKLTNTECAHKAVASSLGIDMEHLAHSSGLGASQNGATKTDIHKLYSNNGIATSECNSEIVLMELKRHNADRGVICLSDDRGLGHVVPFTLENNKLVVNEPMPSFEGSNNNIRLSYIIPHGVTAQTICDNSLMRTINRNRIQKASHSLNFVGLGQGERYGTNAFIFRTLRSDENASNGLYSRGNDSTITPKSHVARGGQNSIYISATNDITVNQKWCKRNGNEVAVINAQNLDILDLTDRSNQQRVFETEEKCYRTDRDREPMSNNHIKNCANASKEVLCKNYIPSSSIPLTLTFNNSNSSDNLDYTLNVGPSAIIQSRIDHFGSYMQRNEKKKKN